MLTSRSEYRLVLRSDNADQRLTPVGREIGLIDDYRWQIHTNKQEQIIAEKERLHSTRVRSHEPAGQAIINEAQQVIRGGAVTLAELLRRPGFHYTDLAKYGLADAELSKPVQEAVEIDLKYAGYLQRQQNQIDQVSKHTNRALTPDIDYSAIGTLSKEAREKLDRVKPLTIGQASRLGGVNPADINALLVWTELQQRLANAPRT